MDSKSTLKSMVYKNILDGIVKDEFKPGQIINEKSLIEKYNVSKSPVREALIALCNENVLKNIPRYGYEVIKITKRDVEDILSFRRIIETGCLKDCINNIDMSQIRELQEINMLCCSAEKENDVWTHWKHNSEFHLRLLSYAGNEFAYNELEKSLGILKRAYAQFYYDKWSVEKAPSDVKCHKKIIDAIINKDIEAACKFLCDDLQDFGY